MIAEGSNQNFHHTVVTAASEQAIWDLWTDVASWGRWDGGLKSASLNGAFAAGSAGTIVPLSGSQARFTITAVEPNLTYSFVTNLPLGKLTVIRRFLEPAPSGATRFEHHVTFSGLLGRLWASQFGPGFRKELPATMERLAQLAETSP